MKLKDSPSRTHMQNESNTIKIHDHLLNGEEQGKHLLIEKMLLRLGQNWQVGTRPENAVERTKEQFASSPQRKKAIWLLRRFNMDSSNKKVATPVRQQTGTDSRRSSIGNGSNDLIALQMVNDLNKNIEGQCLSIGMYPAYSRASFRSAESKKLKLPKKGCPPSGTVITDSFLAENLRIITEREGKAPSFMIQNGGCIESKESNSSLQKGPGSPTRAITGVSAERDQYFIQPMVRVQKSQRQPQYLINDYIGESSMPNIHCNIKSSASHHRYSKGLNKGLIKR